MEGLEEISFEIISHSGQAKAEIMEAVSRSRSGNEDPQPLLDSAKEELKQRSEERRVGKECSKRRSPYQ